MNNMAGKRVVITGGARGIGLAAARAFLAARARVLLADVDGAVAEKAARKCGAEWVRADVGDPRGAASIARAAKTKFGGVDVLVNNAALPAPPADFSRMTPAQWDKMIRVNLGGAYYCARAHLKFFSGDGGCIVNVASTQGIRAQPDSTAYGAAKGGLINLTRALAVDLAKFQVRVNAVAPGFIDTRMAKLPGGGHEHQDPFFREFYLRRRRIPLARPGRPEDVAGPIVFLASDASAYITGHVLVVDGGLLATY